MRAVAALVVSRHTHSTWDPTSPTGKQLLSTCCDIMSQIPAAATTGGGGGGGGGAAAAASGGAGGGGKVGDDDADAEAMASFEHAAEAMSALCMRYEAKVSE